jgi:hypothetical protein
MEERRRYPRKPLLFYARIFDRKTGQLLGHLADITPNGFMLIGAEALPSGRSFHLHLELPEGFAFKEQHLHFEASSIWSQPDLEPSQYATGFELAEVCQHALEIIEQIITVYGLGERPS